MKKTILLLSIAAIALVGCVNPVPSDKLTFDLIKGTGTLVARQDRNLEDFNLEKEMHTVVNGVGVTNIVRVKLGKFGAKNNADVINSSYEGQAKVISGLNESLDKITKLVEKLGANIAAPGAGALIK